MTRVLVLIAALLTTTNAYAQSAPDIHIGIGGQSCGKWLAAREVVKRPVRPSYNELLLVSMGVSWVQGFLYSGALLSREPSTSLQATASIPDSESINAWLDKYCAEHPLEDLSDASISLRNDIIFRALKPGAER